MNNQLVISGFSFPSTPSPISSQMITMDTTLSVVNTYNIDSLTYVNPGCLSNIGVRNYSFKVLPISNQKKIILGNFPAVFNSNCDSRDALVHSILNNNNQILNTNLISNPNYGIDYLDNTNFAELKNNTIYTISNINYNFQSPLLIQPQKTAIKITKLDTSNNIIWSREFGNDMFYRSVSITTTLDSGCLVSGIRYDSTTMYPNVVENFILKLDKNGNNQTTLIKEYDKYTNHKCFPNPTNDLLYFDIPFLLKYKLEFYSLNGELLFSNSDYGNLDPISTKSLASGMYFYKINTSNKTYSGKFIKN